MRPTIWMIIYALILLSLVTPFRILTIILLMIPSLMLYMYLDKKTFMVVYGFLIVLLFFLTGEYGTTIVLFSIFFMIPSVVMGIGYKRDLPARTVLTFGTLTLLVQLTVIIVLVSLLGPNVLESVKEFIQESISAAPQQLQQGWDQDFINLVVTMMTRMLPVYMMVFSLIYVFVTHSLSRQLLKSSGISVAKLPPIHKWMLPKSLVWYYLAALLLDLFTDPTSGTFLVTISWNVIPLLTLVFVVQAISFLFYVADMKRWNKALPIVGIFVALMLPSIVSMLGVFDVAFKLRDHIQRT